MAVNYSRERFESRWGWKTAMRREAQRSKFAIKETLQIQSAEPIERFEAPCESCISVSLHVHY